MKMSITVDTYITNKRDLLDKLMDNVEVKLEQGEINENEYVKHMDELKILYEFYQSPIYRTIITKQFTKLGEYENGK